MLKLSCTPASGESLSPGASIAKTEHSQHTQTRARERRRKSTTLHTPTDNYEPRVAVILRRSHVPAVATFTKEDSETVSSSLDLLHISHCIYFYTRCN
ncbi:hypothetical protein CSKR_106472 [Clonorchis sinensis]|uniref:Uncharacterized protein n=1 Tax=Clonorchis sinensis TaxID=79923 RepID=A0A3R7D729_CLOSI|nr:hypothetical protein CSKR_106472 [Clonorchis sinensis]